MKKDISIITAIILFMLIIGFIVGVWYVREEAIKNNFYKITLADLIKVLVVIIMGTVVAIALDLRSLKATRKYELVFRIIDDVEKGLDEIFYLCVDFMNNPSESGSQGILIKFKALSSKITLMESLSKLLKVRHNGKVLSQITNDFLTLKELVTGGSFGSKNLKKYNGDKISGFEDKYTQVKNNLITLRANFLS